MTTVQLRDLVVQDVDKILTAPVLVRFISAESKRLLQAQRAFWAGADEATLGKLLDLFNQEP